MLRRQVISHDDFARDEYNNLTMQMRTPRKWRTYEASNAFLPTIYYRNQPYIPKPTDPESAWIGKTLVQWDGDSVWDYSRQLHSMHLMGPDAGRDEKHALPYSPGHGNHVFEYEIARYNRGKIYRILYARPIDPRKNAGRKFMYLSKPAIETRPGRMNIVVNPDNDIVLAIEYF
jgi:hypothetical protein